MDDNEAHPKRPGKGGRLYSPNSTLHHTTVQLQQQLTLLLPGAWACRPDLILERSGALEIATRRCPRLRVAWDLHELTHQLKPRLWSLPARLGPVTVHPNR